MGVAGNEVDSLLLLRGDRSAKKLSPKNRLSIAYDLWRSLR